MEDIEQYHLEWKPFGEQLQKYLVVEKSIGDFADISIALSTGDVVQAHKIVLAASSSFFNKILRVNLHPHPLIYFPNITLDSLNSIMEFLYSGQVTVSEDNLESFLEAARLLKVNGLVVKDPTAEKDTGSERTVDGEIEAKARAALQGKQLAETKCRYLN